MKLFAWSLVLIMGHCKKPLLESLMDIDRNIQDEMDYNLTKIEANTYDGQLLTAYLRVFRGSASTINYASDIISNLGYNDGFNGKALNYFLLQQSMLVAEINPPSNFTNGKDIMSLNDYSKKIQDIELISHK